MYCGQITLSNIDKICPLAIPNQISLISINVPSLVKIPWHLFNISSWNKNMGVSREDNCQNLTKFDHKQSQTRSPQYQCTYQVWWKSVDVYSSYHPETKYGRTDDWLEGQTHRLQKWNHNTLPLWRGIKRYTFFSTKQYIFSYVSTKTYVVVLICSASNEYAWHMFSWRNKENIMWAPPFFLNHNICLVRYNCTSWISGRERMTI